MSYIAIGVISLAWCVWLYANSMTYRENYVKCERVDVDEE